MANPKKIGRRTSKQLYDDLRDVFSLYDLEIVVQDGDWLRNVALEDMMCIYVQPFAAHRAFDKDARGAKAGKWGSA